MGDAPFGTDPIPYTVNGAPATNNGDNVHIITLQPNGSWALSAELDLGPSNSVVGGHPAGNGLPVPNNQFASVNSAVFVAPMAAGIAVSNDGQTLVVANYYNDSITVFTGGLSIWLDQWVPDPASPQQFQGTLSGNRTRSASGQGRQRRRAGHAGWRISILGGIGRQKRTWSDGLRVEPSRPRNRCREPGRELHERHHWTWLLPASLAGGQGSHSGQGPAEQDDPQRGWDASVRGRRRVGHRRCDRSQSSRCRSPQPEPARDVQHGDRNHSGHRSAIGDVGFAAGAIYRRQHQQRDTVSGRAVSLRHQWQSEQHCRGAS